VEREPWRSSHTIAPEFEIKQPMVLEVRQYAKLHPLLAEGTPVSDDRPVRMRYFEWLRYQQTANERIALCIQTEGVIRVRVC
jgi:hypothetical protein